MRGDIGFIVELAESFEALTAVIDLPEYQNALTAEEFIKVEVAKAKAR